MKLLIVLGMIGILLMACGVKPQAAPAPSAEPDAAPEQAVADIDQQIGTLDTEALDTQELDQLAEELDLSDL